MAMLQTLKDLIALFLEGAWLKSLQLVSYAKTSATTKSFDLFLKMKSRIKNRGGTSRVAMNGGGGSTSRVAAKGGGVGSPGSLVVEKGWCTCFGFKLFVTA